MATIQSLGVGSGLDVDNLVQQLVAAERQPTANRLARTEARFQSQLSALGTFKGALSALQQSADRLTDADGPLIGGRSTSSSNEDLFTASAESGAARGSFSVEVSSLATSAKLASDPFTDGNTAVGTGTLTLSLGGEAFSVDIDSAGNTLLDIRDAINAASDNPGIQATVINESGGSRLILSSSETGAANSITVTATGGDGGLASLVYDPAGTGTTNLTQITAASDAEIRVDGFDVTSATNSVSGVIQGVTLDLVAADPGNAATLTISEDRSAAIAAVKDFVAKVNSFRDVTDRLTAFNAETGRGGPLLGDATARTIESQVRSRVGGIVEGAGSSFDSLPALGITTNAAGRLEVDEAALNDALDADPNALVATLGGDNGIAASLSTYLDSALSDGGRIDAREEGLQASLDRISDDRARLDQRMERLEARYVAEFSSLDALVGQLNATSNFLTQQLAGLPGARSTG
jgi:flagellar hook-associated protein 2